VKRPFSNGTSPATRSRILDATLDLATVTGLRKFSMEEIARRARMGRATLYLYFSGRDALIAALVEAELTKYFNQIKAVVDTQSDNDERLIHGFAQAYRGLRDHTALRTVLKLNPELLQPYLGAENSPALALATTFVEAQLRIEPNVPEADRLRFAEHIARTVHSLILIPGGVLDLDSPQGPENYARQFLLPIKNHLVAGLTTN
jgi:AcrR family transcriptional regulator